MVHGYILNEVSDMQGNLLEPFHEVPKRLVLLLFDVEDGDSTFVNVFYLLQTEL